MLTLKDAFFHWSMTLQVTALVLDFDGFGVRPGSLCRFLTQSNNWHMCEFRRWCHHPGRYTVTRVLKNLHLEDIYRVSVLRTLTEFVSGQQAKIMEENIHYQKYLYTCRQGWRCLSKQVANDDTHTPHSDSLWWFITSRPLSEVPRGQSWGVIGRIIESLYIQPQPHLVWPHIEVVSSLSVRAAACQLPLWQVELMNRHLTLFTLELLNFSAGRQWHQSATSVWGLQSPTTVSHTHTHTCAVPLPLFWHCCWFYLTVHSIK